MNLIAHGTRPRSTGTALYLCWLAPCVLPFTLLAITGGPCGGPNGLAGGIVLLVVGMASVGLGGAGIAGVCREFRARSVAMRWWSIFSMMIAGLTVPIGLVLAFVGSTVVKDAVVMHELVRQLGKH